MSASHSSSVPVCRSPQIWAIQLLPKTFSGSIWTTIFLRRWRWQSRPAAPHTGSDGRWVPGCLSSTGGNRVGTSGMVEAGLTPRYKNREEDLPVVTSEIGDTWIHGTGTDPAKTSAFRGLLRLSSFPGRRRSHPADTRAALPRSAPSAGNGALFSADVRGALVNLEWKGCRWADEDHPLFCFLYEGQQASPTRLAFFPNQARSPRI